MDFRSPNKLIASVLSVVLFCTNCAFAHTAAINVWDERRKAPVQMAQLPAAMPFNPAQISKPPSFIRESIPRQTAVQLTPLLQALPSSIGSVRKIAAPAGKSAPKILIHIQDVHMNQEAQRNIGKAVQALVDSGQVGLVALEGAFEPIDLAPFRTLPRQDEVRAAADALLRENKISGPIQAFLRLRSERVLPLMIGVDDAAHYTANVDAYRRSAPAIRSAKENLRAEERSLNERKSRVFNPALLAFDQKVQSYRDGRMKMGKFVEGFAATPNLHLFQEAVRLESELDFARVEAERSQALARLASKLDKKETKELLDTSVAYRLGTVGHSDFYSYLKRLCEGKGIRLGGMPALDAYLRYVLLSEKIDGEKLLAEIQVAEHDRYAALAKSPEEKELVSQLNRLRLTKKLIDYSLTKEEWREYRKGGAESRYEAFEAFYSEAEFRDALMAGNVFRAMDNAGTKVAVLVTGGFHSTGIGRLAQKAGVTTVTFVPKITQVEAGSGSAYLSVFTQEKTPLDKLFEGEKLFLARAPVSRSTLFELIHRLGAPLLKSGLLSFADFQSFARRVIKGLFVLRYRPQASGMEFDEFLAGKKHSRGFSVYVDGKSVALRVASGATFAGLLWMVMGADASPFVVVAALVWDPVDLARRIFESLPPVLRGRVEKIANPPDGNSTNLPYARLIPLIELELDPYDFKLFRDYLHVLVGFLEGSQIDLSGAHARLARTVLPGLRAKERTQLLGIIRKSLFSPDKTLAWAAMKLIPLPVLGPDDFSALVEIVSALRLNPYRDQDELPPLPRDWLFGKEFTRIYDELQAFIVNWNSNPQTVHAITTLPDQQREELNAWLKSRKVDDTARVLDHVEIWISEIDVERCKIETFEGDPTTVYITGPSTIHPAEFLLYRIAEDSAYGRARNPIDEVVERIINERHREHAGADFPRTPKRVVTGKPPHKSSPYALLIHDGFPSQRLEASLVAIDHSSEGSEEWRLYGAALKGKAKAAPAEPKAQPKSVLQELEELPQVENKSAHIETLWERISKRTQLLPEEIPLILSYLNPKSGLNLDDSSLRLLDLMLQGRVPGSSVGKRPNLRPVMLQKEAGSASAGYSSDGLLAFLKTTWINRVNGRSESLPSGVYSSFVSRNEKGDIAYCMSHSVDDKRVATTLHFKGHQEKEFRQIRSYDCDLQRHSVRMAINPKGDRIAIQIDRTREFELIDTGNGAVLMRRKMNAYEAPFFTSNGRILGSYYRGKDTEIHLDFYDGYNGELLKTVSGWGVYAGGASSPDGNYWVPLKNYYRQLFIYDIQDPRHWKVAARLKIPEPDGAFTQVFFSPDGKRIALAHGTSVYVWSLENSNWVFTSSYRADGKDNIVKAIAFSPDSRTMACIAYGEKSVHVWKVEDGTLLAKLSFDEEIGNNPEYLEFSPDGLNLILTIEGGVVEWRLPAVLSEADVKEMSNEDQVDSPPAAPPPTPPVFTPEDVIDQLKPFFDHLMDKLELHEWRTLMKGMMVPPNFPDFKKDRTNLELVMSVARAFSKEMPRLESLVIDRIVVNIGSVTENISWLFTEFNIWPAYRWHETQDWADVQLKKSPGRSKDFSKVVTRDGRIFLVGDEVYEWNAQTRSIELAQNVPAGVSLFQRELTRAIPDFISRIDLSELGNTLTFAVDSKSERVAVTGNLDSRILLYDSHGNRTQLSSGIGERATLATPYVSQLEFSPDDRFLLAYRYLPTSDPFFTYVYEVATGKNVYEEAESLEFLYKFSTFSEDGRWIIKVPQARRPVRIIKVPGPKVMAVMSLALLAGLLWMASGAEAYPFVLIGAVALMPRWDSLALAQQVFKEIPEPLRQLAPYARLATLLEFELDPLDLERVKEYPLVLRPLVEGDQIDLSLARQALTQAVLPGLTSEDEAKVLRPIVSKVDAIFAALAVQWIPLPGIGTADLPALTEMVGALRANNFLTYEELPELPLQRFTLNVLNGLFDDLQLFLLHSKMIPYANSLPEPLKNTIREWFKTRNAGDPDLVMRNVGMWVSELDMERAKTETVEGDPTTLYVAGPSAVHAGQFLLYRIATIATHRAPNPVDGAVGKILALRDNDGVIPQLVNRVFTGVAPHRSSHLIHDGFPSQGFESSMVVMNTEEWQSYSQALNRKAEAVPAEPKAQPKSVLEELQRLREVQDKRAHLEALWERVSKRTELLADEVALILSHLNPKSGLDLDWPSKRLLDLMLQGIVTGSSVGKKPNHKPIAVNADSATSTANYSGDGLRVFLKNIRISRLNGETEAFSEDEYITEATMNNSKDIAYLQGSDYDGDYFYFKTTILNFKGHQEKKFRPLLPLASEPGKVFIALNRRGSRIAIRNNFKREFILMNPQTGEVIVQRTENLQGPLFFSPDDRFLLGFFDIDRESSVNIYDGETGKILRTIYIAVGGWAFSEGGKHLALTTANTSNLYIYHIEDRHDWRLGLEWKGSPFYTSTKKPVVFGPDNKTVAVAGYDDSVQVWKLNNSEWVVSSRYQGHKKNVVKALAFSPDGRTVASIAQGENSVHLWKVESGEQLATLNFTMKAPPLKPTGLLFSPDGLELALNSDRAGIRWRLPAVLSKPDIEKMGNEDQPDAPPAVPPVVKADDVMTALNPHFDKLLEEGNPQERENFVASMGLKDFPLREQSEINLWFVVLVMRAFSKQMPELESVLIKKILKTVGPKLFQSIQQDEFDSLTSLFYMAGPADLLVRLLAYCNDGPHRDRLVRALSNLVPHVFNTTYANPAILFAYFCLGISAENKGNFETAFTNLGLWPAYCSYMTPDWQSVESPAPDSRILASAVTLGGRVFLLGQNNKIYEWDARRRSFELAQELPAVPVNSKPSFMAVTRDNVLRIVRPDYFFEWNLNNGETSHRALAESGIRALSSRGAYAINTRKYGFGTGILDLKKMGDFGLGHVSEVRPFGLSFNEKYVVVSNHTLTGVRFHHRDGKEYNNLTLPDMDSLGTPTLAIDSKAETIAVTGNADSQIFVYDSNGKKIATFPGVGPSYIDPHYVSHLEFSPDDRFLLAWRYRGDIDRLYLSVFELSTGQCVFNEGTTQSKPPDSMFAKFSEDGRWIINVIQEKPVRFIKVPAPAVLGGLLLAVVGGLLWMASGAEAYPFVLVGAMPLLLHWNPLTLRINGGDVNLKKRMEGLKQGDVSERDWLREYYSPYAKHLAMERYLVVKFLAEKLADDVVGHALPVPLIEEFENEALLELDRLLMNSRKGDSYLSTYLNVSATGAFASLVAREWNILAVKVSECLKILNAAFAGTPMTSEKMEVVAATLKEASQTRTLFVADELDSKNIPAAASSSPHLRDELQDVVRRSELTPRDKFILTERYGLNGKDPKLLKEVGDVLGVSRELIRLRQEAAVSQLGDQFSEELAELHRAASSRRAPPLVGFQPEAEPREVLSAEERSLLSNWFDHLPPKRQRLLFAALQQGRVEYDPTVQPDEKQLWEKLTSLFVLQGFGPREAAWNYLAELTDAQASLKPWIIPPTPSVPSLPRRRVFPTFKKMIGRVANSNVDLSAWPRRYGIHAIYYLLRDLKAANYALRKKRGPSMNSPQIMDVLESKGFGNKFKIAYLNYEAFFAAMDEFKAAAQAGTLSNYQGIEGMLRLAKKIKDRFGDKAANLGLLFRIFGSVAGEEALALGLGMDHPISLRWRSNHLPYGKLTAIGWEIVRRLRLDDAARDPRGILGLIRMAKWANENGHTTNFSNLISAFGRGRFAAVASIILELPEREFAGLNLNWKTIRSSYQQFTDGVKRVLAPDEKSFSEREKSLIRDLVVEGKAANPKQTKAFLAIWPRLRDALLIAFLAGLFWMASGAEAYPFVLIGTMALMPSVAEDLLIKEYMERLKNGDVKAREWLQNYYTPIAKQIASNRHQIVEFLAEQVAVDILGHALPVPPAEDFENTALLVIDNLFANIKQESDYISTSLYPYINSGFARLLADEWGIPLVNAIEALQAINSVFAGTPLSAEKMEVLTFTLRQAAQTGQSLFFMEDLDSVSKFDRRGDWVMREELNYLLEKDLSDRERSVVIASYGLDGTSPKTLEEIGNSQGGVTKERIRQVKARGENKLRQEVRFRELWEGWPGDFSPNFSLRSPAESSVAVTRAALREWFQLLPPEQKLLLSAALREGRVSYDGAWQLQENRLWKKLTALFLLNGFGPEDEAGNYLADLGREYQSSQFESRMITATPSLPKLERRKTFPTFEKMMEFIESNLGTDLSAWSRRYGAHAIYYFVRDLKEAKYALKNYRFERFMNSPEIIAALKSHGLSEEIKIRYLTYHVFFAAMAEFQEAADSGTLGHYFKFDGMLRFAKKLTDAFGSKSVYPAFLFDNFGSKCGREALALGLRIQGHFDPEWGRICLAFGTLREMGQELVRQEPRGVLGFIRFAKWAKDHNYSANFLNLLSAFSGERFAAVTSVILELPAETFPPIDLGWKTIRGSYGNFMAGVKRVVGAGETGFSEPEKSLIRDLVVEGKAATAEDTRAFETLWPRLKAALEPSSIAYLTLLLVVWFLGIRPTNRGMAAIRAIGLLTIPFEGWLIYSVFDSSGLIFSWLFVVGFAATHVFLRIVISNFALIRAAPLSLIRIVREDLRRTFPAAVVSLFFHFIVVSAYLIFDSDFHRLRWPLVLPILFQVCLDAFRMWFDNGSLLHGPRKIKFIRTPSQAKRLSAGLQRLLGATVEIESQKSGAGVIVVIEKDQVFVLTNHHLISPALRTPAKTVLVRVLRNGQVVTIPAHVIKHHPNPAAVDLALLNFSLPEGVELTAAPISGGVPRELPAVIAAFDRSIRARVLFETAATVSESVVKVPMTLSADSSGSPIANAAGEIIGLMSVSLPGHKDSDGVPITAIRDFLSANGISHNNGNGFNAILGPPRNGRLRDLDANGVGRELPSVNGLVLAGKLSPNEVQDVVEQVIQLRGRLAAGILVRVLAKNPRDFEGLRGLAGISVEEAGAVIGSRDEINLPALRARMSGEGKNWVALLTGGAALPLLADPEKTEQVDALKGELEGLGLPWSELNAYLQGKPAFETPAALDHIRAASKATGRST